MPENYCENFIDLPASLGSKNLVINKHTYNHKKTILNLDIKQNCDVHAFHVRN